MNVRDLINHLTNFANSSPENPLAEVKLQFFDEFCYGIAGANNARGLGAGHFLILVPDGSDCIGVRELRVQ